MKTRKITMISWVVVATLVSALLGYNVGITNNYWLAFVLVFCSISIPVAFLIYNYWIKEEASDYGLAREILGKDLISPEEVMKKLKRVKYTKEQLVKFHETIPEKEILEWCLANNYILVAGPSFPVSFFEICTYFHQKEAGRYSDQNQEDKVETKWYMIRKDMVPESMQKNWGDQLVLISEVETVPNSAELAWAIKVYEVIRNISLFRGISVRTSSFIYEGHQITVINYGNMMGMGSGSYWDTRCNCGLSVARK